MTSILLSDHLMSHCDYDRFRRSFPAALGSGLFRGKYAEVFLYRHGLNQSNFIPSGLEQRRHLRIGCRAFLLPYGPWAAAFDPLSMRQAGEVARRA